MRVAVGGLVHETNTYADDATGLTERSDFTELRGGAILESNAAAAHPGGSAVGGFISAANELGYTLVPTFWCSAGPSGTVSAAAFEALRGELLSGLSAAMPFDAVALDLHGAGVSAGAEDMEGEVLCAVRALVGPDTPIVAPLDLHGNITEAMVSAADFLAGNHLNPHTVSPPHILVQQRSAGSAASSRL
jgi:microcystin degradation protein MlrC